MIGRCSRVCNAGFVTTEAARGKGVGIVMGETYLDFAPKLVFSLTLYMQLILLDTNDDRATHFPCLTLCLRIMSLR